MSSPSPEQREYAALLITKATADQHAAHVLSRGDVADEVIGFHAQQAVEKAAKAVLAIAGVRIPYVHDLKRLLTLASETESPPPAIVVDADWLTPWGMQFRYDEVVDVLDQDAALAACDAALRWATQAFDE